MLLTEEDARKETCPVIRYCVNETDVMQDGRSAIYVNQRCQASDCKMAWRWGPAEERRKLVHPDSLEQWPGWNLSGAAPDSVGFVEIVSPCLEPRKGYCGLAGKPGD